MNAAQLLKSAYTKNRKKIVDNHIQKFDGTWLRWYPILRRYYEGEATDDIAHDSKITREEIYAYLKKFDLPLRQPNDVTIREAVSVYNKSRLLDIRLLRECKCVLCKLTLKRIITQRRR